MVDNDPQFNATSALMKPKSYIDEIINGNKKSIYNIYEKEPRIYKKKQKKIKIEDHYITTWHKTYNNNISLDLLASRIELYETLRNPSHKEYLLDKFLKNNASQYNFIFIDCPPTPSILTLSAFAASDYVMIPVKPDYFSTLGLPQFLGTLESFKDDLHDQHNIKALGVVFTDVPRQRNDEVLESMRRVSEELHNINDEIPVFNSQLSHLKVFEKTLWQSKPVHMISGRGVRGRSEATYELNNISDEMINRIDSFNAS